MRSGACAVSITATLFWMRLLLCGRCVGASDAAVGGTMKNPPDVPEYWPEVAGDLRKVSWAHAVNSQKELKTALEGSVMMLEADVSLGQDGSTPIMAHPPANTSDLTLEGFLEEVIASSKKKGIKLDFKSTEAWGGAVPLMAALKERLGGIPLWLNADIARGPGGNAPGVDAARFLADCLGSFPNRTLSIGWTTGADGKAYTQTHVNEMKEILASNNVSTTQPLTFPVRAAPAAQSADVLIPLLKAWPKSTLTFWGAADDKVDNEKLVELAKQAGFDRVYVDLPNDVPGLTGRASSTTGASALLYLAALTLAMLGARLY